MKKMHFYKHVNTIYYLNLWMKSQMEQCNRKFSLLDLFLRDISDEPYRSRIMTG